MLQDRYYEEDKSKVRYPFSLHNRTPSQAVHAMPYPIDWGDRERMTYFAGFVMDRAAILNIAVRWGGDWDKDTELRDNKFDDLTHFELR